MFHKQTRPPFGAHAEITNELPLFTSATKQSRSWEVCPLCNGLGYGGKQDSMNTSDPCTVCEGEKIISTRTGRPPVSKQTKQ